MALELQPVTKTKVSRTTSSRSEKRWIKVFNSLAGIQDGDEAEIGLTSGSKGAIDLKKIKRISTIRKFEKACRGHRFTKTSIGLPSWNS